MNFCHVLRVELKLLVLVILTFGLSEAGELTLIGKIPYDNNIFTQGLVYEDGNLYISGGLYGRSALYRYNLSSLILQKIHTFDHDIFAEGITLKGDTIVVLTWKNEKGFFVKKDGEVSSFLYRGEGWGVTKKGSQFIMSDGSQRLSYFRFENGKREINSIHTVEDSSGPYAKLNELEYVGDRVLANVWQTDFIVEIDSKTGEVIGKLFPKKQITSRELEGCGVLNGIAYNEKDKTLYITGKNWNFIYLFSYE